MGGIARLGGNPVTVIAIEKGHTAKDRSYRNFGAPNPEGYRKALRLMKQAEKFHRPVIQFINTSGAYGMYHIVGYTPEAPDLETAFGGKEPVRKVVITNKDKEEILKEISLEGNREIDFAMFGCPHFTLEEVKHIAEQVEGKKLKKKPPKRRLKLKRKTRIRV